MEAFPHASTIYYHGDHLGSSRMMTSYNGYPVWQGAYLPFGQEWNPQPTVNHYKCTAKERAPEFVAVFPHTLEALDQPDAAAAASPLSSRLA
jgi:uncharacterized protein RhaS with RHS repeats